jgi:AraC family transcriptional regulator, arabinose operon regulatory protein
MTLALAQKSLPTQVESIFAGEFSRSADYGVWRPGGSEDWLLIVTSSGAGQARIAGEVHDLRPGHALLYAPGVEQVYGTQPGQENWNLVWAHFQPRAHWRAWLEAWPTLTPGVHLLDLAPLETHRAVIEALRRAIAASLGPLPVAADFARAALEEALLWCEVARGGGRWTQLDLRVRRAMDYLAAHLGTPFVMTELARHCGLSASRLAHLFKAQTGNTPQRYAEELKLERAKQLLQRTPASIAEVAEACGYEDAFYFTRRFTLKFGRSPAHWRKQKSPPPPKTPQPPLRSAV